MATGEADARTEAVFELRPMNLADLLDAVVRLYRHNFGTLIRIAAVVHIPLGLIQIAGGALAAGGFDINAPEAISVPVLVGIAGLVLYWVLFFLTMPIVQGAMAKSVAQSHLGDNTSVTGAYRFALRRWFSLLMATILQGVVQVAAFVIPLMPASFLIGEAVFEAGGSFPNVNASMIAAGLGGLLVALIIWTIVLVKLFFGPLTVVLEDRSAVQSLSRSWSLTDGHFVRVGLTMFIVIVFTVVLTYTVVIPAQFGAVILQETSPAGAQALSRAVVVVAQLLLQPVQIVATVLLYYDLRMRKEGFDLVMMEENRNLPSAPPRAMHDRPGRSTAPTCRPRRARPMSLRHPTRRQNDSAMAEKILVVDQERYIVRLVDVNLSRAGYDVFTACSSTEAVAGARRHKPDVIVIDEMMPGRRGLLMALAADPELRSIPVFAPEDLLRFLSPPR